MPKKLSFRIQTNFLTPSHMQSEILYQRDFTDSYTTTEVT
ncbi:hypothetical protein GWL_24600 [Herbaspirillum sp. GW103]|nr:hypothetical protein GWL_24600 [Herbaspirillum sp. GW103]